MLAKRPPVHDHVARAFQVLDQSLGGASPIVSSASCTRFRPLKRRAKDRDCVSSTRVAGRRLGVSGMVGR